MPWLSEPCALAQLFVTSRFLQDRSVPWGQVACCREDRLLVALPFPCFTCAPAVSRSSLSVWHSLLLLCLCAPLLLRGRWSLLRVGCVCVSPRLAVSVCF